MDLKEKCDIIRETKNKECVVGLFNEEEDPMMFYYPKNCNWIFIEENYLILESFMYKEAVKINLNAIKEILVLIDD